MTTRKYELTTEKTKHEGRTLYRIRALKNFSDVKAGDLGGFVESEKNLSQEGNCWIYDDSKVIGRSKIVGCSKVKSKSIVDNSTVMCSSKVKDSTIESSTVGANKSRVKNAKIDFNSEYITVARIGSRNDTLTAYRCANGEIGVATGCFTGNIDEFVAAVKDKHKDNKYAKQYLAAINLIKLALNPGIKQ